MTQQLNSIRHRLLTKTKGNSCFDDIDLELQTPTDQNAVFFLKNKINRMWKILEQINETLYHENTATIIAEKPIFDEEKKKLVMLMTIVEKQLCAGNFLRLKEDFSAEEYSKYLLKVDTNFGTWNSLALEVNNLIKEIQKIDGIEKSFLCLEKYSSKQVLSSNQGSGPRSMSTNLCYMVAFVALLLYFIYIWMDVIDIWRSTRIVSKPQRLMDESLGTPMVYQSGLISLSESSVDTIKDISTDSSSTSQLASIKYKQD